HAAPTALVRRLRTATVPAPAVGAQARPPIATGVDRWFDWRPLAASLGVAAVATVVANTTWTRSAADRRIESDVVASHVRSTLGQHLVDVSSSDHHQVKPFLSARLGFSPPVGELQIQGSELLGGRVDYLDGRPVAALVYRQGPHVVDSFVWPSPDSDGQPAFSQERGFRIAHWIRAGMAHWVISDVNAEEFRIVVRAVERGDGQR
ncbi:MAG: anti-sigma factor, partial [Burkholderiaceae bacterium]